MTLSTWFSPFQNRRRTILVRRAQTVHHLLKCMEVSWNRSKIIRFLDTQFKVKEVTTDLTSQAKTNTNPLPSRTTSPKLKMVMVWKSSIGKVCMNWRKWKRIRRHGRQQRLALAHLLGWVQWQIEPLSCMQPSPRSDQLLPRMQPILDLKHVQIVLIIEMYLFEKTEISYQHQHYDKLG